MYAYTVVGTLYLSVTSRAPSTTLAPTATSTSPTVAPTGAVTLTSIYIKHTRTHMITYAVNNIVLYRYNIQKHII